MRTGDLNPEHTTEEQRATYRRLGVNPSITLGTARLQGVELGVLYSKDDGVDVPVAVVCDTFFFNNFGPEFTDSNGAPLPRKKGTRQKKDLSLQIVDSVLEAFCAKVSVEPSGERLNDFLIAVARLRKDGRIT